MKNDNGSTALVTLMVVWLVFLSLLGYNIYDNFMKASYKFKDMQKEIIEMQETLNGDR